MHSERWEKVWRVGDGVPLAGAGVSTTREGDPPQPSGERVYPTRRGIDTIIAFILNNAAAFSKLVGERGKEWSFLTAKAFLYPPGTGLSWHIDSKTPTGAYVFYSHPEWKAGWGGELLIADESAFGKELGLSASDEVDRAEPVYALVLADNIDMATTAFLQIPNRLATSPND